MRNGMIVVMVLLGLLTGAAQAQPRADAPCVGLVLGGGGARGARISAC